MNDILASQYPQILRDIQQEISQTQRTIFNTIARQRLEMAWRIGKIIDVSLAQKDEKTYGKELIRKLEKDCGISDSALYKMRNFYKAYPQIPQDDPQLNWTHYRILSGVKEVDKRHHLENLVKDQAWTTKLLQQEVKKLKDMPEVKKAVTDTPVAATIKPRRGILFTYKIKKISGSDQIFLDFGFGVCRNIQEQLPVGLEEGAIVHVTKQDGLYSIAPSTTSTRYMHTYKAFVEKVVDGDTLRVNLDLGFGIFQHEILRLANINAPEKNTAAGKASLVGLSEIVQEGCVIVIKSLKTDIYGRYVADVFLPQGEKNLQAVADGGVYLNQLLLDQKLVEVF